MRNSHQFTAAPEHPGGLAPDGVPGTREQLERLLRVDDPQRSLALERTRERRVLSRDRDFGALRRHAIAEAAVDRVLGRPQERERLATLVHVVELRAHHRAQNATPPVRGERPDDGHARGRHDRAGHRQLEGERAGAADDRAVLQRRVHALDREVLRETLHALLGRLHAEVLPDREDGVRELGEVRGRAEP